MSAKPLFMNPYTISTAMICLLVYGALVIHVFLLAPDVIGHDKKGFALIILVVLPGKYLVNWALKSRNLRRQIKNRLNMMLFAGCVVGWTNIEFTEGFGAAVFDF